jgi:hypothetical protein
MTKITKDLSKTKRAITALSLALILSITAFTGVALVLGKVGGGYPYLTTSAA